jgi:hypothetical protein
MSDVPRNIGWLALFCILALYYSDSRADTWLDVTLTSYHFKREPKHNEHNLGLGFEHDIAERWRVIGGAYKNSLYRTSVYAGVSYSYWIEGPWRLSIAGGGITGYEKGVMPIVVPALSYEGDRWGANLFVAPPFKDSPGVAGLQVKVRF